MKLTGKITPEAVAGQGAGQGEGQQQLAKIKEIMSSKEFKQLPKEKQKAMIQTAREVVAKIKGGK